MQTKKIGKKLFLSKTTIVNLDQHELSAVKGGYVYTEAWGDCTTWHPICFTKPVNLCQTQLSFCICRGTEEPAC